VRIKEVVFHQFQSELRASISSIPPPDFLSLSFPRQHTAKSLEHHLVEPSSSLAVIPQQMSHFASWRGWRPKISSLDSRAR
jgi:hypothetical protein